jgi:hypothetical protein
LIIGGTQDQQCHADIPHLIASIHDKQNKTFCEPGYEINREAYNDLMVDPYAPSSIMIDLCVNRSGFFFNIPKCYTDNVEDDTKSFTITHDTKKQRYKIKYEPTFVNPITQKKFNYTQYIYQMVVDLLGTLCTVVQIISNNYTHFTDKHIPPT